MCFVYLSPATKYTLGRGATSGYLGTSLKPAGYDGVIVTGAAQSPSIFISAKTKSSCATPAMSGAKAFANRRHTAQGIRPPDARVGAIGPAGEI
jgi:aldehyde:ferredoxin oxidoreductase